MPELCTDCCRPADYLAQKGTMVPLLGRTMVEVEPVCWQCGIERCGWTLLDVELVEAGDIPGALVEAEIRQLKEVEA